MAFDSRTDSILSYRQDIEDGQCIRFFDKDGACHGTLDLAGLVLEPASDDDPKGKQVSAGDSMSILRFVRGNKTKRLEISPSGKS